jgi:hypothetical protein
MLEGEKAPYKVWVFFQDRGFVSETGKEAALNCLEQNYNVRALKRRVLRSDLYRRTGQKVCERDLPISTSYKLLIEKTGAVLARESRWLNAVSVFAKDRNMLEQIQNLDCVASLRPVARGRRPALPVQPASDAEPRTSTAFDYGRTEAQLRQINVIKMHEDGYTGSGVVIGVLDSGFKRSHEAFNQPGHVIHVLAEYDFVNDDPNTAPETGDPGDQHDHGTEVLSVMGAYYPGEYIGDAPDASFILCKTEEKANEYQGEEDNYVAGIEFAETNGADMITTSLGYIDWYTQADLDGDTAVTTLAVNIAVDNGMHYCNAVGNEGHDTNASTSHLIAPADAYKVISCGAVTSSGSTSSFSSDGPTADGRLKPEILALGSSAQTIDAYNDSGYTAVSGTSFATPLVAGAVACLIQAHPDWTVDEMRNAIFQTGGDYVQNGQPDPLFVRGYGILNTHAILEDCNNNGVSDLIEIAQGLETDCQQNGIPDSCEIADGSAEDCNFNGLPDSCDLAPPSLIIRDDLAAVYGWIEIAPTGTALGLSDDAEAVVDIPFTNAIFSTGHAVVGNNGGVGFSDSTSLSTSNEALPSSGAFSGEKALLPFWDDLDSDTGDVFIETSGTAPNRIWVVQWDDRPHYSGDNVLNGDEITFQVQIFENQVSGIWAQCLYEDVDFQDPALNGGASATSGYQSGSDASQYSFNQASLTPSTVLSLSFGEPPFSSDDDGNGIPDECDNTCLGDFDLNNTVDTVDMGIALSHWHGQAKYDVNRDSRTDIQDILTVLNAYGSCESEDM